MRQAAAWLAWTGLLFAFWLLLVDTVDLAQLVAGVVTAALGGVTALFVEEERDLRLRPRARWALRLPGVLGRALLDCGLLALVLARALVLRRRPRGRLRAIRFEVGATGRRSGARRAAAKWLDSLGPNSYVIGVDAESDLMLVHQLVPPDDPASADPMELR